MKEQLKKKETILLLIIHLTYLIAVLLYLSEDLEVFIYPILFYAATLAGRRFLSIVLWREQQSNKNLFLIMVAFYSCLVDQSMQLNFLLGR